MEYFHVVFTLPEQPQPLVLKNRRALYAVLFAAASETLLELAVDPKRLGAQIGITAVLHTWGQNLLFHPHLHCVVTGGGLSPDGRRWVPTREGYFLPVQVLSRLFRGKFLAQLKRLYQDGRLTLSGSVSHLVQPPAFQHLLDRLYRAKWVVYAKPPFGGAEQVYRYLGRYTHRLAISNSRLISMRDSRVQFHYKDYADGQKNKRSRAKPLRRYSTLPMASELCFHFARAVDGATRRCRTSLCGPHELIVPPTNLHNECSPAEPSVPSPAASFNTQLQACPLRRNEG